MTQARPATPRSTPGPTAAATSSRPARPATAATPTSRSTRCTASRNPYVPPYPAGEAVVAHGARSACSPSVAATARPVDGRPCASAAACEQIHPAGIADPKSPDFHGTLLQSIGWNFGVCAECHGADFAGGTSGKSCLKCHSDGPTACTVCHAQPPPTGAHVAHGRKYDCTSATSSRRPTATSGTSSPPTAASSHARVTFGRSRRPSALRLAATARAAARPTVMVTQRRPGTAGRAEATVRELPRHPAGESRQQPLRRLPRARRRQQRAHRRRRAARRRQSQPRRRQRHLPRLPSDAGRRARQPHAGVARAARADRLHRMPRRADGARQPGHIDQPSAVVFPAGSGCSRAPTARSRAGTARAAAALIVTVTATPTWVPGNGAASCGACHARAAVDARTRRR